MSYDAKGVIIATKAATNAINNCCLTPYESAKAARKVCDHFEKSLSDSHDIVEELIEMLTEE